MGYLRKNKNEAKNNRFMDSVIESFSEKNSLIYDESCLFWKLGKEDFQQPDREKIMKGFEEASKEEKVKLNEEFAATVRKDLCLIVEQLEITFIRTANNTIGVTYKRA